MAALIPLGGSLVILIELCKIVYGKPSKLIVVSQILNAGLGGASSFSFLPYYCSWFDNLFVCGCKFSIICSRSGRKEAAR